MITEPLAKQKAQLVRSEIGMFPSDWPVRRLDQIAGGVSVGLVINPSTYISDQGTVPMLLGSQVTANRIDHEAAKRITPQSNAKIPASILRAGDLVTVRVGDPGTTAVIADELDGCNCASMMIIRRHSRFNSAWLSHLMNSPLGQRQVANVQYGTAQKQFNIGDAVRFLFPVPPRPEQDAIGQAISDADALIDSLEQLLTKKRQIKQGAMQELLTGKRRLPGFKDPWVPRSMADLFDFSGGLSASRDQLGDTGPCYLHYGDIHLSHKTHIDLDAEHHQMPRLDVDLRKVSSSALLRNGDVVFVDASEDDQGVSKHVVVHSREAQPLISGLHTIVARPKSDELVDLYKRYCFQAPPVQAQFRYYAVGTKVSGVSKGNIGKIMLNVPLPVEQKEIAACLAEMDSEIYALESRLTKARALKQAMAQALLTGKIRLI